MGLIIALRSGDRIYLGTNINKVRAELLWRTKAEFNLKIHKLKNGVIIGAVGALSKTQRLYLNESWFKPPKGVPFDKKFLVTSVVPKYIALLRDLNQLKEPSCAEEDYPHINESFIVINGDDAFIIDGNFGVYIMNDIAVITDDEKRVVGDSLVYTLDRSDPERFMKELFAGMGDALKDYTPEVAVLDTKNTEFRYYGGQYDIRI